MNLKCVIGMHEWNGCKCTKCGKTRDDRKAVEPLILKLNQLDERAAGDAAEALAKIGDPRALPALANALNLHVTRDLHASSRIASALQTLGWNPTCDRDLVFLLVATHKWTEIPVLGSRAVQPLIAAFESFRELHGTELSHRVKDLRVEIVNTLGLIGDQGAVAFLLTIIAPQEWDWWPRCGHWNVVRALCRIGSRVAIDPILRFLANEPWAWDEGSTDFPEHITPLRELLGSRFVDIVECFCYEVHGTHVRRDDGGGTNDFYKHHTQRAEAAVRRLCGRPNPVSTNVLILVEQMKDAKVTASVMDAWGEIRSVSYETSRKMAREELQRRGNPIFNSTAFLHL